MRALSFLQVLLLLGLLAYVLLVALENPILLRFPLPMGRGEWLVPGGLALGGFAVLGGLYATLLFLPVLARLLQHSRMEARTLRSLEDRLASTLQARLAALPSEPGEKVSE
ncbi:hypothetical protein D3875_18470 [Deinococcus cavernae]|uniref:DUF1049 domain-containing protein n=1 Tax=Deinococcus cavernae TaxID=2320857 RepID=A0A418VAY4_9DEIO|nr:hypothetical protein [Deinococcus cavernae]RJF73240.1 hypothetical protein D3875_18470 [Deinococcus cavernae]